MAARCKLDGSGVRCKISTKKPPASRAKILKPLLVSLTKSQPALPASPPTPLWDEPDGSPPPVN